MNLCTCYKLSHHLEFTKLSLNLLLKCHCWLAIFKLKNMLQNWKKEFIDVALHCLSIRIKQNKYCIYKIFSVWFLNFWSSIWPEKMIGQIFLKNLYFDKSGNSTHHHHHQTACCRFILENVHKCKCQIKL